MIAELIAPVTSTTPVLRRTNPVSAEAIIPTQARELLESLRGKDDVTRWSIGDLTAALVAELAGTTRPVYDPATGEAVGHVKNTKADVRAAVADLVGLGVDVVRQYEAAAEHYTSGARARFDMLTWTHFRYALGADEPERWLAWCLESADDHGGKFAPPRVLKAAIDATRPTPVIDPHKLVAQAAALIAQALDAPNVPLSKRAIWQIALDALKDA